MIQNDQLISWLQYWYETHCDGDWEHDQNVIITTIDNPGWSVTIKLEGTSMKNQPFSEVNLEKTDSDWLFYKVQNNLFLADGGPFNLLDILQVFKDWVEKCI